MGILFNSIAKVKLHPELQKELIIERLVELQMVENREGKSIHDMDVHELKVFWILSEMMQVDIDHPEHRWFR